MSGFEASEPPPDLNCSLNNNTDFGRLHHPLVLLSIGALAGGSLDGGVEHASLAHRHTELMKSILPPAKMQPILCLAKQPLTGPSIQV